MNEIKSLYVNINYIRSFPLLILYLFSKNKELIKQDIQENLKKRAGLTCNWKYIKGLNYLLSIYPEFRNVFYYRIGRISKLLYLLYPPMKPLYITSKSIGKGLVMYHGFSTIIYAKSLGERCTVYQQVTIGKTTDIPTIGNNVTICPGAKVIGGINIGDNVIIGAGSIVTKDIPANCVVAGNPAIIIKQNGIKVRKNL